MILLDLFAGIGGFSYAGHQLGWQTAAFVEREPFCQKVLRKNFGEGIEIHDDIFKFSGKPFRGRVDIITGGFPCQPFSAAGKRLGVTDERYLFPETLRVIREVQPAWIILENVNGLISMANETRETKVGSRRSHFDPDVDDYEAVYAREEKMLLHDICHAIEREGYEVQPIVIPASAVGAWHERKRIWIVAHAKSDRKGGEPGTIRGKDGRPNGRVLSKPFDADIDVSHADGDGLGRRGQHEAGQRQILPPGSAPDSHATDSKLSGSNASDAGREYGAGNAELREYEGANRPRSAVELERPTGRDEQGTTTDAEGIESWTGLRETRPVENRHQFRNGGRDAADTASYGPPLGSQEARGAFGEGEQGRVFEPAREDSQYPDTESERLQRSVKPDGGQRTEPGDEFVYGRDREFHGWREGWTSAAARFCGMADGLSDELDLTGSRDNRVPRLKALGNSILPQVALELFKAIDAVEKGHAG